MADKGNGSKNRAKKAICAAAVLAVFLGLGAAIGYFAASRTDGDIKADKKDDGGYDPLDCIEVGDYKGLEVSIAVTQDDLDAEIDDLRDQNTIYEQLDGNVSDGDMIYADIVGYVDGKRADDACTSDYVVIGSGDWMDGFEDALIGTKTGTTAEFTLPVPMGTFGNKDIDGHDIKYDVKVEYICGDAIVPEYNDEFVQSISDCDTTEEYDEYLRGELLKENEDDRADFAWADLMEASKVKKYPDALMEQAKKTVLQGYYDMADVYGYSTDEVFVEFGYESEEDFKKTDLDGLAKDTVKENLLAQALAQLEDISYTQEEYEDIVAEEYSYCEEDYSSREEYEAKNEQYLKDEALMEKVKDWLADNVTFVTKQP